MADAATVRRLPVRKDVPVGDTWDLSTLCRSDAEWEAGLAAWEARIPAFAAFAGTLGSSAERLAECLANDVAFDREGDRLGTYAHLRASEDQAAPEGQRMAGRFQHVATRAGEAASFIGPEILAIPSATLDAWMETTALAPYRLMLERLVRTRPHVLSDREEKLLAMQGTFAGTAAKVFRQLTDADLRFGSVANGKGEQVELSNATFTTLLHDTDPAVRRTAFHQFYAQYQGHANTLAAALSGSNERDVYAARPVRRRRAAGRLRPADRRRPLAPARGAPVLRAAPAGAPPGRDPPLRLLRAARAGAGAAAHLGPGGGRDRGGPGAARRRLRLPAGAGTAGAVVRPLSQRGQAVRRLQFGHLRL
jgi:hypothetical protein